MPAHSLENPIRAGLERRVEMGREVRGSFDQQARDRVVDLGGFDGREAEANLGDSGNEGFEKLAQGRPTPGPCPGAIGTRTLV